MSDFSDLSYDTTIGAFLIGVLVSGALWGISCLQFYDYLGAFPEDKWPLKLLVAGLWLLDTAHQILISHATYTYVITHYADTIYLITTPVWTVLFQIPLQGIIAFIVQLFFVQRIWRLSQHNLLLSGTVLALVLAQLASIMLTTAHIYNAPPGNEPAWIVKANAIRTLEPISAALATGADVLIAAAMLSLLQRSKTGLRRTDGLLSKLMMFSMGTGLMTTVNALIILVTFYAWPNTFVYSACFFVTGRLYVNSFLASLNLRRAIARPRAGAIGTSAGANVGALTAAHPDALFSTLGPDFDLDEDTLSDVPGTQAGSRRAAYPPARASRAFPPTAVAPGGGVAAFRRWKADHGHDGLLGADGRSDTGSKRSASTFAQPVPTHVLLNNVRSQGTTFPPQDVEDEPTFADHPYRLAKARSTLWEN